MTDREAPRRHHISSAVVSALPQRVDQVLLQIEPLPGAEVHRVEGGKIVVVLEGSNVGEIGGRLAVISLIDGVLSANLVFEQIEELDDPGVDP